MGKPGRKGLARLGYACGYSWLGLKSAWRCEAAFRQELVLALVLVPLAIWLGQDGIERALLAGSIVLVLVVELLNSAVEAVADRFGAEQHELCGRAKDMGSAAVLISLLLAALIWILVLAPRLPELIRAFQ